MSMLTGYTICTEMFMNGVGIGTVIMLFRIYPILWVHNQAPAVRFAAAVGATVRGSAGRRSVATARPTAATATLASASPGIGSLFLFIFFTFFRGLC